ncbi:unnamed protein product, partial [Amoebophrya sp. A120]|eukprot:GSA120T00010552001.1
MITSLATILMLPSISRSCFLCLLLRFVAFGQLVSPSVPEEAGTRATPRNTSNPKIRLAVIGSTSAFARKAHFPSLRELPDRYEIVANWTRQEVSYISSFNNRDYSWSETPASRYSSGEDAELEGRGGGKANDDKTSERNKSARVIMKIVRRRSDASFVDEPGNRDDRVKNFEAEDSEESWYNRTYVFLLLANGKNPDTQYSGGVEESLPPVRIDAVLIILPIGIMPKFVNAALEHNIHVLSEKPVLPALDDEARIQKQYPALSRVLQIQKEETQSLQEKKSCARGSAVATSEATADGSSPAQCDVASTGSSSSATTSTDNASAAGERRVTTRTPPIWFVSENWRFEYAYRNFLVDQILKNDVNNIRTTAKWIDVKTFSYVSSDHALTKGWRKHSNLMIDVGVHYCAAIRMLVEDGFGAFSSKDNDPLGHLKIAPEKKLKMELLSAVRPFAVEPAQHTQHSPPSQDFVATYRIRFDDRRQRQQTGTDFTQETNVLPPGGGRTASDDTTSVLEPGQEHLTASDSIVLVWSHSFRTSHKLRAEKKAKGLSNMVVQIFYGEDGESLTVDRYDWQWNVVKGRPERRGVGEDESQERAAAGPDELEQQELSGSFPLHFSVKDSLLDFADAVDNSGRRGWIECNAHAAESATPNVGLGESKSANFNVATAGEADDVVSLSSSRAHGGGRNTAYEALLDLKMMEEILNFQFLQID